MRPSGEEKFSAGATPGAKISGEAMEPRQKGEWPATVPPCGPRSVELRYATELTSNEYISLLRVKSCAKLARYLSRYIAV